MSADVAIFDWCLDVPMIIDGAEVHIAGEWPVELVVDPDNRLVEVNMTGTNTNRRKHYVTIDSKNAVASDLSLALWIAAKDKVATCPRLHERLAEVRANMMWDRDNRHVA